MAWNDAAFLLGGHVSEDGTPKIDVLTRAHGRRRGDLNDGADQNFLERGCALQIALEEIPGADASIIEVDNVEQTYGNSTDDETEEVVITALKALADPLIPLNVPMPDLFEATQEVVRSLGACDGRWPIAYARWEFEMLSSMGFIRDVERCRPALRHGETIYYAPKSNRWHTRAETGAFLDRMLPVPVFLFGGRNASVPEVVQALDLMREVLHRHVLPKFDGVELPEERTALISTLQGVSAIPRIEKEAKSGVADDAEIKRRMLATRPLQVSFSITAAR